MIYISFLRGINVGGHKKIKMAELKKVYELLGLNRVETYIQSGNVIFEVEGQSESELETLIQDGVHAHFGFEVPVQVLTAPNFEKVIDQCPFAPIDLATQGSHYLVTFLDQSPPSGAEALLKPYIKSSEKVAIIDKVVYFYCSEGYGRTRLNNAFIESKLKVTGTTRNWKTVSITSSMSLAIS